MAKEIEKYNKESLLEAITSIKQIISENKMALLQSANAIIIKTYWKIGKRIVEIEQNGKVRAEYGSNLLKNIAIELTGEYGSGYSERNLAYARKAYVLYPDYNILQTRLQNLSWSHFLCSETSKDMARFSVMHNNPQLYAAKYLTYLPSEEELRREIERQKEIYQMQHDITK